MPKFVSDPYVLKLLEQESPPQVVTDPEVLLRLNASKEDLDLADPTKGMSIPEKLAVGAGSAVARSTEGVGRLWAGAGLPGSEDMKRPLQESRENRQIYGRNPIKGPWDELGAILTEILGGGPVLKLATKGGLLTEALGSAAYSGATEPDDRLRAAALGGGGQLGGRAVGEVATRVAPKVLARAIAPGLGGDPSLASAMREEGMNTTVGLMQAVTKGKVLPGALQKYEGFVADIPGMGRQLKEAWKALEGRQVEGFPNLKPVEIGDYTGTQVGAGALGHIILPKAALFTIPATILYSRPWMQNYLTGAVGHETASRIRDAAASGMMLRFPNGKFLSADEVKEIAAHIGRAGAVTQGAPTPEK